MARLLVSAAACVLLLHWMPPLIGTAASVDISLPDWALRIGHDGLFRLDEGSEAERHSTTTHSHQHQDDETLLEWASRITTRDVSLLGDGASNAESEAFLVIGAKTSVLHGFHYRQAIRQTWASVEATPANVRVVFLGCEADVSMYAEPKREELQRAIALEKRVFGDLLTSELSQCQDSFAHLADKVKAFMQWTARAYPTLAYAMVVDDDVYLRVDLLLELLGTTPRTRFFGGNSASSDYRGLGEPIRDPRNKYYLPSTMYPPSHFPPYLCGAHVILSRDLVSFIARNFNFLRGFGALDDTTLGIWLLSLLHVKPTYIDAFQDVRYITRCHEQLISLADLSTISMKRFHANLLQNRSLCDGIEVESSKKPKRTIQVPHTTNSSSEIPSDPGFQWDPQFNGGTKRLQIEINVTFADMVGVFVYTPSFASVGVGLCGQASSLLQEKFFVTVGDVWCAYYERSILASLSEIASEQPGMRGILALPRHNLHQSLAAIKKSDSPSSNATFEFKSTELDPFLVGLSRCAQTSQVLLECLFVDLNPTTQVLVFQEDEWTTVALGAFVACSQELPLDPSVYRRARRVVVLEDSLVRLEVTQSAPTAAAAERTDQVVRLPLPMVSRVFSHTIKHSPAELLQDRPKEAPGNTRRSFAAVPSTCDPTNSAALQPFFEQLTDVTVVNTISECNNQDTRTHLFALDHAVDVLRQFKFVIVSDAVAMVSTLLAGCVPVYCGPPSAHVAGLFNPRAFVDCSLYDSFHACAQRVKALDKNSHLFEEFHDQSAIVDDGLFREVFFWHPDAVGSHISEVAEAQQRRRMRQMLQ